MRFCYYKARTSHTTRQIITRVPINPYPNIAVSSNLKIVGFEIPMNYLAPMAGQCMSHLAHNPSRSWMARRVILEKPKITDGG